MWKMEDIVYEPKWTVSELWVYPIKSCKGTALREGIVTTSGLQHDREYMVVDAETGMFVAQRGDSGLGIGVKSMCQITPKIESESDITLSAPGMNDTTFEMVSWLDLLGARDMETTVREVQVWKAKCQGVVMPDHINNWFTEFLGRERPGNYQLVCFRPEAVRRAKVGYSQLQFADGYPFLVISQESLDDLNRRISDGPLPMNRFRPNIVIQGGRPYDEDRLHRMVINDVDFEGMELCVRCPITTQDQQTTERHKEPLRTLATYRRNPVAGKGGVVFGRNYNHLSTGRIAVGDRVDFRNYSESGPCDQ
jgi:uncharacterized protein